MAKGRKPIPTQIKVLKGTQRKGRKKNEPKSKTIPVPIAPKEWAAAEKDRYYRICEMLSVNKLLTDVNFELIFIYVEEMKMYFKAIDEILEKGSVITSISGDLKINPWVRIRDMAFKNAMTTAREFGFTPSSATKIHIPDPGKEGIADDEFGDV